ncbi:MAG: hypothetical protein HFJ58_02900 [Clostridia bacterium]|nr:hypothetical protein [Clostridia bacterium]
MLTNYIEKLEFNKVLDILSSTCITEIGKNLAKNLQPENKKDIVSMLLKETTEATTLIYKKHIPPFVEIINFDYIEKMLKSNSSLNAKNLLEIARILKLANNLKTYFFEDNEEATSLFPILDKYFSMLYINSNICTEIEKCILDEATIADNASVELLNIRRKEKNLEETIKNKLNSFIHSTSYSKYIQENVITIRNERYVIPIKEEYRSKIKGFVHDVSSSGSTVFIEPMSIFELNNEIANLKLDELKEIEKILFKLSTLLFPIVDELKTNVETIGKLDFIFAKAKYSINLDAIEPELNDDKLINLISARHPFIPKASVVPIDINLGISFSSLVITGPNTGGKTVTLKTVRITYFNGL